MSLQSVVLRDGSFIDASGVWDNTSELTLERALKTLLADGAAAHNSIYRGKYLGTSVTADLYLAISNGTFKDLYIGDYWTIGGVNYRIAAFNYWYNCGDTTCTTNHVVIVPDKGLYSALMNTSNVTTGGYIGSAMYTSNLASAKTTINSAFGSAHILNHREIFTNAVTNGYGSSGAWVDSTIDLMNELMVYGSSIFENRMNGTNVPYSYTIDKALLPLFALDHSRIEIRADFWLRDVASASLFAFVYAGGACDYGVASYSRAVRPAFAIKA